MSKTVITKRTRYLARYLVILIIAGLVLYIIGNGNYTLFDNSETNYSAVAQEIINTGDPLSMHYNGTNWYVHPPLYFWLSSAYCQTFGWTEFNLRLFEGLFGILGIIVTFLIAKLFFSNRTSFLSALMLGSSLYYIVISRLAIFDTLLNFFILLSVYAFFLAFYRPSRKMRYAVLFSVSAALAVLTKGPIGIVHPLMIIVPFLLWKRNLRFFLDFRILPALLLFLVMTVPWYAHQLILHGQAFFDIALRDYTWYRFFGVVEHQNGPWYYYFPVLLFFYPWIFFLPEAVSATIRTLKSDTGEKVRDFIVFSWLFIGITFLFFSVAQTKLPNYIFTIFPFLAILTALFFRNGYHKPAAVISAGLAVIAGLIPALLAFIIEIPAPYDQSRVLIGTTFLLLASVPLVLFVLLLYKKHKRAIYGTVLGACVFALFLTHIVLPNAEQYKESRLFVGQLRACREYTLINYKGYSPYLMYYLNHPVIHVSTGEQLLAAVQDARNEVFLLVPLKKVPMLNEFSLPYRELTRSQERLLCAITPHSDGPSRASHGKELD